MQDPQDLLGHQAVQARVVQRVPQEIPVLLVIQVAPGLQVQQLRYLDIRFREVQEGQEEMQVLGAQVEARVTVALVAQAVLGALVV